jgi:hypothetical protein
LVAPVGAPTVEPVVPVGCVVEPPAVFVLVVVERDGGGGMVGSVLVVVVKFAPSTHL